MRSFFRHLRAAWLFGRTFAYVEKVDAPDFWTDEDARWLTNVLSSHHGKKLKMRLTNYVVQIACGAVRKESNTRFHNGIATGASLLVAHIESHTLSTPEQVESQPEFAVVEQ